METLHRNSSSSFLENLRAGTNRAIVTRAARLALVIPAVATTIAMTSGCAQVMAIRQPAPINRNLLTTGADRTTVIGVFGAPVSTEQKTDGQRVETYRYVDGGQKNVWWSKTGRVVVYTAGDVFTAWLDQIIWMPLELAFRGTDYVSTVGYDQAGNGWAVRNFEELEAKSGKQVRAEGMHVTPIASR